MVWFIRIRLRRLFAATTLKTDDARLDRMARDLGFVTPQPTPLRLAPAMALTLTAALVAVVALVAVGDYRLGSLGGNTLTPSHLTSASVTVDDDPLAQARVKTLADASASASDHDSQLFALVDDNDINDIMGALSDDDMAAVLDSWSKMLANTP